MQEGGAESLRSLLQIVCQAVLEAEMAQCLGDRRYERTPDRSGQRHGYKSPTLTTPVDPLPLRRPQDREGQFHTPLFERYQRREKARLLTLPEMYRKGGGPQGERGRPDAVGGGVQRRAGLGVDPETGC